MSTYLSLHNDHPQAPRYTADDVRTGILPTGGTTGARWQGPAGLAAILVAAMDDEIREQVHGEMAPCTPREFLARYLELATKPLVIG